MYEQYALNPEITRQRLFYEAMEELLPGVKVVVDNGNTQTVLPLEQFADISVTNGGE